MDSRQIGSMYFCQKVVPTRIKTFKQYIVGGLVIVRQLYVVVYCAAWSLASNRPVWYSIVGQRDLGGGVQALQDWVGRRILLAHQIQEVSFCLTSSTHICICIVSQSIYYSSKSTLLSQYHKSRFLYLSDASAPASPVPAPLHGCRSSVVASRRIRHRICRIVTKFPNRQGR